jgi:signaling repeat-containing protein
MTDSYDYRLVELSVVIAICASYAALDLAGRTTAASGRVRLTWLAGGATATGSGIWSMHYIGMLAFSLPVLVLYDWPTVLGHLRPGHIATFQRWFSSRRAMSDCWKEIASFLNRGVRTVERWEAEDGLPVHRIGHGRKSPVFALPKEIQDWLRTRGVKPGCFRSVRALALRAVRSG